MLNSLLSSSSQKQVLGVALTPGLGLEIALYDKNKNIVLKHGRKKVEYNFSTREIQNYVEFKSALGELVNELAIAPKTPAYLVLPNVHFDFFEIPTSISEIEINTALLSQAEDFYLFKKEEPISGWCNVANIKDPSQRRIAYNSFQRAAVDKLKDIFADVNLQLIGVEGAYSATVRGLYAVGLLNDVISKQQSWTMMFINTNSFTLMNFDAENLIDVNEVPIAIKSFSTEEAYATIASGVSQLLDNFSTSRLYVISQTDDISAVTLKDQIPFDGEIVAIDTNRHADKPVIEVMQASDFKQSNSLTFGVIGASNPKNDIGLSMNVLADEAGANSNVYFTTTIMGTVVEVTSEVVMKLSIALGVLLAIIFIVIYGILWSLNSNVEKQINEISTQINTVDAQIQSEQNTEDNVQQGVDITSIIDDIANINVKALKYYDSISTDIPKNIWLTKYYNNSGDKIVIQGIAEAIPDIYEYFKNLKIASPESDIKLNDLKVMTEQDDAQLLKGLYLDSEKDRLYSFEISNTTLEVKTPEKTEGAESESENILIKPMPNMDVEKLSNQVKPTDKASKRASRKALNRKK